MAWSWSHTQEAYEIARYNLGRLKKGELNTIYSEWRVHLHEEEIKRKEGEAFDNDEELEIEFTHEQMMKMFEDTKREARKIPHDILADQIWEWASEASTCDNGGWNAWVCPDGCHTVSFSPPRGFNLEVDLVR